MTEQTQNNSKTKPDLIAKIREHKGDQTNFLTIGAAWTKEDGGIYVKLYGNQIIDAPFYLFPANRE